ncbi:MAG: nuclear transport factor 2 family protein [Kofleriaceae bacterium]
MLRLSLLLALVGCHAAPRDTIAEVRAASKAFDDAQLRADRAAIDRFLAKDLVFVRGSGKVADREAFLTAFTSATQKLDPYKITNARAIQIGTDAVLIGGEAVLSGSEHGERFSEHFVYADLFQWRDGRWQVIYIQVTKLPPVP